MLADDIVLCSRKAVLISLEKWRHVLEKLEMEVGSKIQYMTVNEKTDGQLNLKGVWIKNVKEFNCLGSTAQEEKS